MNVCHRPRPALPLLRAGALLGPLIACAGPAPTPEPPADIGDERPGEPSPGPGSSAPERDLYLGDRDFRRRTLLASLTRHGNHYSQRRIANYGLTSGGWDALPEWTPNVRPLRVSGVGPSATKAEGWAPLWDGERPSTDQAWVELGRRVFFRYPLRAELPVEHLVRTMERAESHAPAEKYGLRPDAEGRWAGLVEFVDDTGQARVGITCALCHSALIDGAWSPGHARRSFDYGQLRLDAYAASDRPLDPEYARSMAGWGPGRADITDDRTLDPVAIPDLWRIAQLDHLTQAGTLRQVNASALAIRQETQYVVANGQRSRPPRVLIWALTRYLYSLEAPAKTPAESPPDSPPDSPVARGRAHFQDTCARCHSGPSGSGPLIPAEVVGTDPALASGVARGTRHYRPSPLVGLAEAGPYLHDGTLPSLEALLDPARLQASYPAGARGPGPIPGHAYGMTLSPAAKQELLAYLRTL